MNPESFYPGKTISKAAASTPQEASKCTTGAMAQVVTPTSTAPPVGCSTSTPPENNQKREVSIP